MTAKTKAAGLRARAASKLVTTANHIADRPFRTALLGALNDVVLKAKAEGRTVPAPLLEIWRRHHG